MRSKESIRAEAQELGFNTSAREENGKLRYRLWRTAGYRSLDVDDLSPKQVDAFFQGYRLHRAEVEAIKEAEEEDQL